MICFRMSIERRFHWYTSVNNHFLTSKQFSLQVPDSPRPHSPKIVFLKWYASESAEKGNFVDIHLQTTISGFQNNFFLSRRPLQVSLCINCILQMTILRISIRRQSRWYISVNNHLLTPKRFLPQIPDPFRPHFLKIVLYRLYVLESVKKVISLIYFSKQPFLDTKTFFFWVPDFFSFTLYKLYLTHDNF